MSLKDFIVTAGVYVNINGLFAFQVGPTESGTTLGVVRLGGHRENDETGWQCASREAYEEASIKLSPMKPPATYWFEYSDKPELKMGEWQEEDVEPILVGRRKDRNQIAPIYLACSQDSPTPAAEAKGILLLTPAEIKKIVSSHITLGQYLYNGGKAVLKDNLPLNLILEPYPHLRLLDTLIHIHPEITTCHKLSN
jgi:ADP-ribose pyrophosphatase